MTSQSAIHPVGTISASGVGAQMNTTDYRHLVVEIYNANLSGTFKIRGALDEDADLTAAASATNRWAYQEFTPKNNASGGFIDGDTGDVHTTDTGVHQYAINSDLISAIAVEIVTLTGGTCAVFFKGSSN